MTKRIAPKLMALYFLAFALFVLTLGHFWYQEHKTPEQPINFSHQIHVSKVGLQ